MLTDESALIFLNHLEEVYYNGDLNNRQKSIKFKKIINELLKFLTENEPLYFPTNYARSIFLFDKFNASSSLTSNYRKIIYRLNEIVRNKKLLPPDIDIESFFNAIKNLIDFFAGDYSDIQLGSLESDIKIQRISELRRTVVLHKNKLESPYQFKFSAYIDASSEESGNIRVFLSDEQNYIYKIVRRGSVINFFNISFDFNNSNICYTNKDTIIIYEPDILVDVTDIAECFQHKLINYELYFLKLFDSAVVSYPLLLGNVVNEFFDLLINNKDIDFETAFSKALRKNPLKTLLLAHKDENSRKQLRNVAFNHFQKLNEFVNEFTCDRISIEPTFISPDYGIQGRLDALIEYNDEANRKDVVELKSGRAPSENIQVTDIDGKSYISGVWNNHLAQATCYNILLDSCFEGRVGTSGIIYSSTEYAPLRNVPNILKHKRDALKVRNIIVAIEKAITDKKYDLIEKVFGYNEQKFPKYKHDKFQSIKSLLQNLDEIEKTYLSELISFIYREEFVSKIGSDFSNRNGFSNLWNESLSEKEGNNTILSNLKLIHSESDIENLHLVFQPDINQFFGTSFRAGDIAILYNANINDLPQKNQIIKATIKHLDSEKVKISLRNKSINSELLKYEDNWVLEPDYLDSKKKTVQSLMEFIKSKKGKKQILLGLTKPEFEDINFSAPDSLNVRQKEIFLSAIRTKNYYLIQGPPGTGKTSYIVKSLVEYYYNNINGNILISAYTNRAADEICLTLDRIIPKVEYIRIGSKESTQLRENLLAEIVEHLTLGQLYRKFSNSKIIVSTVASLNYYPELFELKPFEIAIIDEASQILEAEIIGILSRVDKFILIGDEKQLPSVVVQHPHSIECKNEILKTIKLNNLAISYFERLLRICKENNWHNAYGMLNEQSRMHPKLLEFVNYHFYNDKLQTNTNADFSLINDISDFKDEFIHLINQKRLIFIETKLEKEFKLNRTQALYIELIVNRLYESINQLEIGIISPFRAQCAEIYSRIKPSYRDKIIIDTIERFQGSEKDIIILSLAINSHRLINTIQSIAEMDGSLIDRKLNVAITRAKKCLIILGNSQVLSYSPIYFNLINHIKEKGNYFCEGDFGELFFPKQNL